MASKAGAAVGAVMGGGTAQKQGGQGGSYGATQQQHSSVGAVGKNQGADVPHKEPEHDHEHDAIRDSKRHAENIASGGDSAADPKPYAGDDKPRQGSLTGHLPGAPGGEGLQKTSKGHGTGQQYVKSSGLAAEGGDFDASKPGAGKEADRKCLILLNDSSDIETNR